MATKVQYRAHKSDTSPVRRPASTEAADKRAQERLDALRQRLKLTPIEVRQGGGSTIHRLAAMPAFQRAAGGMRWHECAPFCMARHAHAQTCKPVIRPAGLSLMQPRRLGDCCPPHASSVRRSYQRPQQTCHRVSDSDWTMLTDDLPACSLLRFSSPLVAVSRLTSDVVKAQL